MFTVVGGTSLVVFFLFISSFTFASDVQDSLYDFFQQHAHPINSYNVEQLKGGFSNNKPYLCVINEKKYVARLLSESYAKRKHEILIHSYFADQGIAPRVHYYADDYSFMVMDFIEGNTLKFEDAQKESVLKNIADVIYRVHEGKIDDVLKKDIGSRNMHDDIIDWYNTIKEDNLFLPVLIEDAFAALEGICKSLEKEAKPFVLSHNDVHLRNIFFRDNQIILIDWEMVQLNYAFYDAAVYSIYACLNDDQEYYFLTQYLKDKPTFFEWCYFKNTKLLAMLWSIFGWLDFLGPIPDAISNVEDYSYYVTIFAQNAHIEDSKFFFEWGFSLLKRFFKEYEACKENKIICL